MTDHSVGLGLSWMPTRAKASWTAGTIFLLDSLFLRINEIEGKGLALAFLKDAVAVADLVQQVFGLGWIDLERLELVIVPAAIGLKGRAWGANSRARYFWRSHRGC